MSETIINTRYKDGRRYSYKPKFNKHEKKGYIKIAKELCYPSECIERLQQATSHEECSRILTTYRLGGMEE